MNVYYVRVYTIKKMKVGGPTMLIRVSPMTKLTIIKIKLKFIENIIKHRKFDMYFAKYLFNNILHTKTLIVTDYENRFLFYKCYDINNLI